MGKLMKLFDINNLDDSQGLGIGSRGRENGGSQFDTFSKGDTWY